MGFIGRPNLRPDGFSRSDHGCWKLRSMGRRKLSLILVLFAVAVSMYLCIYVDRPFLDFLSTMNMIDAPRTSSVSINGLFETSNAESNSTNICACWTVVWLVPKEWEVFYIDDILADLPLCTPPAAVSNTFQLLSNFQQSPSDVWSPGKPLSNQTILVLRFYLDDSVYKLLQQAVRVLKRNGFKFTIFLLSDEKHPDDASCGLDRVSWMVEQSDLLLRQYYTHDCATKDNVLVVPLLVTTQAHNGMAKFCQVDLTQPLGTQNVHRTTWMYFSSNHELPARTDLSNALRRFATTTKNNRTDHHPDRTILVHYPQLSTQDADAFAHRLSSSRYAAIVQGNSEDTYRFAEALLCGAVPFMEDRVHQYYQHWLPPDLLDAIPYYRSETIHQDLEALWLESNDAFERRRQLLLERAHRWFTDTRQTIAQRVRASTCG